MPIARIDDVADRRPRFGRGSRLWSEWCFALVCLQHFRRRLLLMVIFLSVGATLFIVFEPEKEHSIPRAAFYTFALIFGEPPEEFPEPLVLQALFFVMPLLGLTVIIEGIIDFALILRDRRRSERSWCVMLSSSYRNHIVIVGLGRLGYRTYHLLRRMGEPVVVIERDPANQFLEEVRREGTPLLIGDSRREALLQDANIATARSIVLATSDDMANLECGLDARRFNPNIRVVMRMFDQNVADKVRDGFRISLAMSQSAISAPTFASCAVAPATVNSFILGDQVMAMQRWLVRSGDPLDGLTVAQVMERLRMHVIEHAPSGGEAVVCPSADTRLHAGDGIALQGPLTELGALRERSMGDLLEHAATTT